MDLVSGMSGKYFNEDGKSTSSTSTQRLTLKMRDKKKDPLKSVPMVNNIGDENSYFNSIIHMLFYTKEIYQFLHEKKVLFNSDNTNYQILGELHEILDKYNRLVDAKKCYLVPDDQGFLDVKNLRIMLSELYKGEGFFKLNESSDPADLLYFFLNAIHSFSIDLKLPKYYIKENNKLNTDFFENKENNNIFTAQKEKSNKCDPKCISHKLFDMHLIQQIECNNCKSTGPIMQYDTNFFIYEIKYKLLNKKIVSQTQYKLLINNFFKFAKDFIQITNDKCPKNCEKPKVINKTYVMEPSPYFIFTVNWKEIMPTLEEICKCYFSIPKAFQNTEIFDVIDKDLTTNYLLYGFICYWNGHYISFFFGKDREWYFYEDMNTKKMPWKDILIFCIKNHYHPIMLFFRKVDTRAILYENVITEKDYNEILTYCKTVDKETLSNRGINNNNLNIDNKNIKQETLNFLKPVMEPHKTNDYDIIRMVMNFQKLEEMREKKEKLKKLDDMIEDEQYDGMNPVGINIFAGKWICEKCKNHNNFSIFQCSECQYINVKVYQIIYNNKKQGGAYRRNFKTNPSKFEKLTQNFEQNYSNLIKMKLNLTKNDDAYLKVKKIKEDEDKKYELEMKNKNEKGKKVKFIINADKTWTCPYCGFFNEDIDILFCENCKLNKPRNNETVIVDNEEEMFSSVRQYL